jgi:hypothetical protein
MTVTPIHQPQAGEVWILPGVGKLKIIYTGSRFSRVTELDGSKSRLVHKSALQPLPPPPVPPKPRSLDDEFLDFDHK